MAHVLRVLELLEGPEWPKQGEVSFPLAFGALLHDIGKRRTMGRTPERYTFHGHEHIGKDMSERIARRLKLSNDEVKRTAWLVERHQYLSDAPKLRRSKLLPILIHPGIGELLALHRATLWQPAETGGPGDWGTGGPGDWGIGGLGDWGTGRSSMWSSV